MALVRPLKKKDWDTCRGVAQGHVRVIFKGLGTSLVPLEGRDWEIMGGSSDQMVELGAVGAST